MSYCSTRNNYVTPSNIDQTPYLFEQLARKRSRTNSSSMEDDMDEEDEHGFRNNSNRSPGSQSSTGWEMGQGNVVTRNFIS